MIEDWSAYMRMDKALWEACGEKFGEGDATDLPKNPNDMKWAIVLEDDMELLSKRYGFEKVKGYLKDIAAKEGQEVDKLRIYFNYVEEGARVRSDWPAALRSVEKGSNLSSPVRSSFYQSDMATLVQLHKEGKFRQKIEDLLDDCEEHKFTSLLKQGKYEETEGLIRLPQIFNRIIN